MKLPQHIHCIGIGGIGVSGIAKLLHALGVRVSGSDATASPITDELTSLGISVAIGHDAGHLPKEAGIVIFSEAVPSENPERVDASERGIPVLSAAEFLGAYTADKRTIAVSGTNGKSTTTAMLGSILVAAGMDPTVILGSSLSTFPLGNVRVGKSDIVVLEADEYRAKYLNYHPEMIVLTNIEEDHLDFFADLTDIVETFDQYLGNLRPGGTVILNADDMVSAHELHAEGNILTYGIVQEADYNAKHVATSPGAQQFELHTKDALLAACTLPVPGRFNIANALAAATAAHTLGVSPTVIAEALAAFPGIWRRFEIVGERNGATIVSDYGHHPTAIRVTVSAAREFFPHRRIVLVFQPHQHNRTARLFEDFVAALHAPDIALISDIYHVTGREETTEVTAKGLAEAAGRPDAVFYSGTLGETQKKAESILLPGDVVIVMGAGTIDEVARGLVAAASTGVGA
jgi:UDP-N-acetylmuramate--alanine ligase